MLISVLNIKLTCEWHKAIQLNYINTRTNVAVVLRVPSTLHRRSQRECAWAGCRLNDGHAQCTGNMSREPGTVRGTARRPHFTFAIISVTVQLQISVFLVRSMYFNLKNILPKSGTFLPGHPVYNYQLSKNSNGNWKFITKLQCGYPLLLASKLNIFNFISQSCSMSQAWKWSEHRDVLQLSVFQVKFQTEAENSI